MMQPPSSTSSAHSPTGIPAGKKANRLIHEKSPYLLQHAHNPVDWYPWGEEAFARARQEDKPLFLSIGYSTCHWCHVMERESFENDSIATILNSYFVSIKVDREERPDVDHVYMTALQAMGQNGGWPMSMFLTPGRKPFYGGTYFPPESRYGRAGFPDVLRRIHEAWTTERGKVTESANSISSFLEDAARAGGGGDRADDSIPARCFDQIAATYDRVHGGFGAGPKFPRPVVLDFLLRSYVRSGNSDALTMATHTLGRMAAGGTYDHIGGGFHRYSVDGEWRVPHFEKMLYDQAQLVQSFLNAYLITKDRRLATVAGETLDYVLRDMTDPGGGFYSAEDADSQDPDVPGEPAEGAFYVWTTKEIVQALGDDAALFARGYGVEEGGNALSDPQHEFVGKNILWQPYSPAAIAKQCGLSEGEVVHRLTAARRTLFDVRLRRPRPLRDDKVLTSWNGLMIGAFARGWRVLGEARYGDAARRAAAFVRATLYDPGSGLLRRRYRQGEAGLEAHLVDYAFLVSGLLDLYESSGDGNVLVWAVKLTEKQIELFHDTERGGFFDTSGKDSSILVCMKGQYDGAEPTGNSVTVLNLLRLSQMLDRPAWRSMAEETVNHFAGTLKKQPIALPLMVSALDALNTPPRQIVIAGPPGDGGTIALANEVFARYRPLQVILWTNESEAAAPLSQLNSWAASLRMINGQPTAYCCDNFVCDLPVSQPAALARLLEGDRR